MQGERDVSINPAVKVLNFFLFAQARIAREIKISQSG